MPLGLAVPAMRALSASMVVAASVVTVGGTPPATNDSTTPTLVPAVLVASAQ